jgi:ADP-ribose pyrophosphatase YjhB (NUDIX family)
VNKAFNLRVYALIVNDKNEILLSDEYRFGKFFTKFPGGGVEFGEGILDALNREMDEELNLKIDEAIPFYFNDFHQESAFQSNHQIISFYYKVKCDFHQISLQDYSIPFQSEGEKQRWCEIGSLETDHLTFPIDRIVLEKLKNEKIESFPSKL